MAFLFDDKWIIKVPFSRFGEYEIESELECYDADLQESTKDVEVKAYEEWKSCFPEQNESEEDEKLHNKLYNELPNFRFADVFAVEYETKSGNLFKLSVMERLVNVQRDDYINYEYGTTLDGKYYRFCDFE